MMSKSTARTDGAKKTTTKAPAKRAARSPSAATPSRGRPAARRTATAAKKAAPAGQAKATRARPAAKRKAEQMEVPFLGEVPLNISLRERGDEGRIRRREPRRGGPFALRPPSSSPWWVVLPTS